MDKHINEINIESPYIIMTLILSEQQCSKCAHKAKEKGLRGGVVLLGKGTVKNLTLNFFGIKSQKKEVVSFLVDKKDAKELLDYFTGELQLDQPGHGIAYTTPVIMATQLINDKQDIWNKEQYMEDMSMYKKLTVIVNRGMSDDVMEIARKSGVTGGTIMHGRGTGSEYTEKLFGIEIEPEKDLVMILMPSDLVDKVVNNIYQELHMEDPGNGILFVEPVIEVRGLFK